eukprot:1932989-Lingulodinium_polyedra.AAC.1
MAAALARPCSRPRAAFCGPPCPGCPRRRVLLHRPSSGLCARRWRGGCPEPVASATLHDSPASRFQSSLPASST